jgi:hypothetical protein
MSLRCGDLGTIRASVNTVLAKTGQILRILSAIMNGLLVVLRLGLVWMKNLNYLALFGEYGIKPSMNREDFSDAFYAIVKV